MNFEGVPPRKKVGIMPNNIKELSILEQIEWLFENYPKDTFKNILAQEFEGDEHTQEEYLRAYEDYIIQKSEEEFIEMLNNPPEIDKESKKANDQEVIRKIKQELKKEEKRLFEDTKKMFTSDFILNEYNFEKERHTKDFKRDYAWWVDFAARKLIDAYLSKIRKNNAAKKRKENLIKELKEYFWEEKKENNKIKKENNQISIDFGEEFNKNSDDGIINNSL